MYSLSFETRLDSCGVKKCFVKKDGCIIGQIIILSNKVLFYMEENNVYLESRDVVEIFFKLSEVEKYGFDIPTCPACGSTPLFPIEGWLGACKEKIHPLNTEEGDVVLLEKR